VNQDPLGIQGVVVYQNCTHGVDSISFPKLGRSSAQRDRRGLQTFIVPNCEQIWTRKLSDGYAVAFVNYTNSSSLEKKATVNEGGGLRLDACNASDETQFWNVTVAGGLATIAADAGDKACWEVRGCTYNDGSVVDTNYGCKALPPAGDKEACDNNMIWSVNRNGTITSAFSGKCFEAGELAGAYLTTCTGSHLQQWRLQGSSGKQHIVSAGGKCITRGSSPQPPEPPQTPGQLTFDISSLGSGWEAALVRDLWAHTDIGTLSKITVRLNGDGDSRLFKLTQATRNTFV